MRHTKRDLRDRLRGGSTPGVPALRSLVRRLRVVASAGVHWALEGHQDGEDNLEKDDAEVFSGVGFYSRAKRGHRVEAVTVAIGGASGHPAIVGTRDYDGVKLRGSIAEDETTVYNSQAHLTCTEDGEIHAASIGATPAALATKADLETLKAAISGATVSSGDGGAAFKAAIVAALAVWPVGTTTLKAE